MIAPLLTSPDRQAAPAAGRFFDELPALACLIGSDGCLKRVNGAWFDLLGHPLQSLVGKPFAGFFHGDELPSLEAAMIPCGPQERWDRFEARFRCADGSYKWLLWQFKTDWENRLVYATSFDISDRKEDEAAMRRRLTSATFQAQVWPPLTKGCSASQALEFWAEGLQRHLSAREVRVWTPAPSQGKPVLQARSAHTSAAGELPADVDFLEQYVRQVLASRTPLLVPDVNGDVRLAAHREFFRIRQVRALFFQPVLAHEEPIAAIGVFSSTVCGAAEGYFMETAAREIGAAWSHLLLDENLRDTKRTCDALVRMAPVGISRLDADGNVGTWNAGAESILGWRPGDILNRRFPIAGGSARELFDTCVKGAVLGKSTSRIEIKCWSSSGNAVDVALSISPLSGLEEKASQPLLVFEDLTDRKRALRSVRLQNTIADTLAGARSIDEALQAALACIGGEFGWACGEFWHWNQPDQVLQRTVSWNSAAPNAATFAAESRSRAPSAESELLVPIVQGGKPRRFVGCAGDRSFARSDLAARCGFDDAIAIPVGAGRGVAGVLFFFAGTIDEPDDQFLALLTAISDQISHFRRRFQTEESLRESEENLLQAKKMEVIGRLVGGVVHDFNNVLTVILGCGEIVLEENSCDQSTRDLLSEVINAGRRAAGLTRQLLAFCRKEAAHPVVLDLNATVTEMEKLLRRLIGREIELETVLAPDLGRLNADPGHIEQVIMNLVVNARDAMPKGGQIVIKTHAVDLDVSLKKRFPGAKPGQYALLSVSDTGCGMDEATQSRIFDPFFTTKAAGQGTGMGLATVREIVKETGGQIGVESQVGKGTTFQVLFPTVAQDLASWKVDSVPASVPRGNEVILVVDDDAHVRRLISRVLEARGYSVQEAAGAHEAMDRLRADSRRIDLLITDVIMPRMNGRDLATELKTRDPNLKVLFVSGYGESENGPARDLDRDTPFLQKPFTTYDLARKVRDLCDS